jgi:two-component system, OmpR family, sensor histidine kinase VicK
MPYGPTMTHSDEAERLKALLQYEILDTASDPALDEITRLAAQICVAPLCIHRLY